MQIGNNTLIQCWAIEQFDIFQKSVQTKTFFHQTSFGQIT